MTVPFRVGEDPLDALKAMKAQSAQPQVQQSTPDPLEELKALQPTAPPAPPPAGVSAPATGVRSLPPTKAPTKAPTKSRTPIRDALTTGANALIDGANTIAAHGMSALQVIPGMEAFEAALGVPVSYLPGFKHVNYAASLADLRGETNKINPYVKTVEQTVASLPLLGTSAVARMAPAAAGAMFGGLHGATKADPGQSVGDVVGSTALGAGTGALLGKGAEVIGTAVRAVRAKDLGANAIGREAKRAASAADNYGRALAEGQGKPPTPAIQQFLQEPDAAEIIGELQRTRQFRNVPADAPEMLDAAYKVYSDHAAQIKKGLESVAPTRPNIGRFRAEDVGGAKQQLLGAMEAPGPNGQPPVMPSYRAAVEDFARRSSDIDAVNTGADAAQRAVTQPHIAAKNLPKKSPQAFARDISGMGPSQAQAGTEGALGRIKEYIHGSVNPLKGFGLGPSLANVNRATPVVRQLDQQAGNTTPDLVAKLLTQLGLSAER